MSFNTEFDSQLAEIQAEIDAANQKKKVLYKEAVARVQNLITAFNIPASALKFGEEAVRPRRGVIPPKYKNPFGEQTWAGRGAKPKWFSDALEQGVSEEDMLINK